jgi:hypothetical protein
MRVSMRFLMPLLIALLASMGCGNKSDQREVRDGDPKLLKDARATDPPHGGKNKMPKPPQPRVPKPPGT